MANNITKDIQVQSKGTIVKKNNNGKTIFTFIPSDRSLFWGFPCHFSSHKHNIMCKKIKKLKSVQDAVTHSDVIFAVVPSDAAWGGVGHPGGLVLLLFGRTAGAQHGPSDDEKSGGGKTDIEGRPDLPFLRADQNRVVEISYDHAGGPRHGNQDENPSQKKENPGNDHDFGFGGLVFDTVGALGARDRNHNAKDAQYDGDDCHGAGGLEFLGQS